MQMDVRQNLQLYKDMIQCAGPLYLWAYNDCGRLVYSNCPDEEVLAQVFELFGCKKRLYDHLLPDTPMQVASSIGLQWCAAAETDGGKVKMVYLIGPYFTENTVLRNMELAMRQLQNLNLSVETTMQIEKALKALPTLATNIMNHYAITLNYCVTGVQKNTFDIYNITDEDYSTVDVEEQLSTRDRHKVWTTEQALLRMVREGDLNYAFVVNQANSVSNGVKVVTNEILGQARTSVIVFTSLCCRAAIEGGLSPEEGYTLGDAYIQRVADAKNSTELGELSNTMYADFVHRVHRCRTNPEVSKQIQDCCAYIELHAEEEIPIDQLAKRFGYAEYYLTKKFKREMHTSLTNYIKYVRIERAKLLLTTTGLSLQEIADRLHFCSRSYFGKIFHEVVGCSPLEYRQKQ